MKYRETAERDIKSEKHFSYRKNTSRIYLRKKQDMIKFYEKIFPYGLIRGGIRDISYDLPLLEFWNASDYIFGRDPKKKF